MDSIIGKSMNTLERFKTILKYPYPDEFISDSIPVFCHKDKKERELDKYDREEETTKRNLIVDTYTGIYAFGYELLHLGHAESLYRTINAILSFNLDRNRENIVLDVGCGVGRTIFDCADHYPDSLFIGMDYSYKMVERAKEIVLSNKIINIDLSTKGFGKLKFRGKDLRSNVIISQGDVRDLPFKEGSIDCVINTYTIDRVKNNINQSISEISSVLKPGGLLILTDPLNFESAKDWDTIATSLIINNILRDHGIEIVEYFDSLICRFLEDERGNYRDWLTFVTVGRKKQHF